MFSLFKSEKIAAVYQNDMYIANICYKTNKEKNEKLNSIMNKFGAGYYTIKEIK